MSKCCKEYHEPCCDYGYGMGGYGMGGYGGGMSGYGNIFSLIILILIVCQFCKKKKHWDHDDDCDDYEHDHEKSLIDNSILFIIAIFILVFCSCGKGYYGGRDYGCC